MRHPRRVRRPIARSLRHGPDRRQALPRLGIRRFPPAVGNWRAAGGQRSRATGKHGTPLPSRRGALAVPVPLWQPHPTADRIATSRLARPVHPVVNQVAENLAGIGALRIVKVTPGFLQASSEATGARRQPTTKPGHPTAVGVSLIIDGERGEVQFYEITSAVKGYGSRMVDPLCSYPLKKSLPKGSQYEPSDFQVFVAPCDCGAIRQLNQSG
jgi:hypothetical protein